MNATSTWTVVGMTCEHCVTAVMGQVGALPGVAGVEVDLATGRLRVAAGSPVDAAAVRAAVSEAGFEVRP